MEKKYDIKCREDFDFYINKRWFKFLKNQIKKEPFEWIEKILQKFPDRRFELNRKDVESIAKGQDCVIYTMKNGKKITVRKPQVMKYERLFQKMDRGKIQIAIFMKNITSHYSGGRYWTWLLAHIIAEDPDMEVTIITNENPPFGKSFKLYDNKNLHVVIDEEKDLFRLGKKVPKNCFDYVIGIPIEGGISAEYYADKWGVPCYCLFFETPNFIRSCPGNENRSDAKETTWMEYKNTIKKRSVNGIINNTEIGSKFFKEWLPAWNKGIYHLWNTTNIKVIDSIKEPEIKSSVKHIVYIGRFIEFKRIPHIVRALNLIADKKFIFHIISGKVGHKIEALNKELKPHVKIQYHDKIDDYEKYKIVKQCNMMVCPTSFEGFGITPMEAVMCDRICICYELEILQLIYKNSVIFAKDFGRDDNEGRNKVKMNKSIKALSDNIRKWIDDSPEKKEHIRKAKEYADRVFSHDRVRADIRNILSLPAGHIEKKRKKYCFGIMVWNGAQFIEHQLHHIYDMADEIIIVEGAVKVMEEITGNHKSSDATLSIINKFKKNFDDDNKIRLFSSSENGKPWENKIQMQNIIAENVNSSYYIKQDVDEFYDLDNLKKEIEKMESQSAVCINYKSYHFWGDLHHVIVGKNFNDKQTRVWKWNYSYRHTTSFNLFVDMKNGMIADPRKGIISQDVLFHYSYLYNNKTRENVLEYYKRRKVGVHNDIQTAWISRDPSKLENGYKVKEIKLNHPTPAELLQELRSK